MQEEFQFPFDRLYSAGRKMERHVDPVHDVSYYEPLPDDRQRTGVKVLDTIVDELMAGHDPTAKLVSRGYRRRYLAAFVYILTGMTLTDFCAEWQRRMTDELLRYTTLPMNEVAWRVGFSTPQLMARHVRQLYGCSPSERRAALCQKGDAGRYQY